LRPIQAGHLCLPLSLSGYGKPVPKATLILRSPASRWSNILAIGKWHAECVHLSEFQPFELDAVAADVGNGILGLLHKPAFFSAAKKIWPESAGPGLGSPVTPYRTRLRQTFPCLEILFPFAAGQELAKGFLGGRGI
jgi:hypothetical protein